MEWNRRKASAKIPQSTLREKVTGEGKTERESVTRDSLPPPALSAFLLQSLSAVLAIGQLSKLTGGNVSSSSLRHCHFFTPFGKGGDHRKNGYWWQRQTKEEKDGNDKLAKLETRERSCNLRKIIPTTCFGDNFVRCQHLRREVL